MEGQLSLLKKRLRTKRLGSKTSIIAPLPCSPRSAPAPRTPRCSSAPAGFDDQGERFPPGSPISPAPDSVASSPSFNRARAPTTNQRIQPRRVASSDARPGRATLRPMAAEAEPPNATSPAATATSSRPPRPGRTAEAPASRRQCQELPNAPASASRARSNPPQACEDRRQRRPAAATRASSEAAAPRRAAQKPRSAACCGCEVPAAALARLVTCSPIDVLPALRRTCLGLYTAIASQLTQDTALRAALDIHLEWRRANSKRVWVVVRARPSGEAISCINIDRNRVSVKGAPAGPAATGAGGGGGAYFFDHAFNGSATQEEVCDYIGGRVLPHAMNGEHVCLMAYGQTGSGKTHTMFGSLERGSSQQGLAFRAVTMLAGLMRSRGMHAQGGISIEFSFLEVYNDELYDLLDGQKKLSRQRSSEKHVVPQGLTRRQCEADKIEEQVHAWLCEGASTRTVGKTVFNPRSSRSHGIVLLHICWGSGNGSGSSTSRLQPPPKQEGSSSKKQTRIYLVDLAGSERAGLYAMDPEQLKEGEHINLSLSALGRVVGALSSGKCKHVPYRDSALTWLLKDAITGTSARACLVAAVHPGHAAETSSTLRYARQYSAMQASGGGQLAELTAQVRTQQRLVDNLRHALERALAGDEHGIPWTRESLHGTVQPSLHARELIGAHPYLTWTASHQSKYLIRGQRRDRSGIGKIRSTADVPPPRDPSDPPDGRTTAPVALSDTDPPPERVAEVVFEGRHGRPPVVLWFPESALEEVQPPKALLDAMEKLESAEEVLGRKRAELQSAKGANAKAQQEWMAKDS